MDINVIKGGKWVTEHYDDYKGVKILFVTDMHLTDKEKSSTIKAVDNNQKIFDELEDFILENKDIGLVVFGGDIQDHLPKDLYEMARWRAGFTRLGEIMRTRLPLLKNLEVGGLENPVDYFTKNGSLALPLFTIRGNHDNAFHFKATATGDEQSKDSAKLNHTFFDDLVDDKKLFHTNYVKFNDGTRDILIDMRDYNKALVEPPKELIEGAYVITDFHDSALYEDTEWIVKVAKNVYQAKDILKNSSLGIMNHLHKHYNPYTLEDMEQKPIIWEVGSIARMKYAEEEIRDVGYSATYDTGTNELGLVELELIPVKEYFSPKKVLRAKQKEVNNYQNITLAYDEEVSKTKDPVELLQDKKLGITDEVKDEAVRIIKKVTE